MTALRLFLSIGLATLAALRYITSARYALTPRAAA